MSSTKPTTAWAEVDEHGRLVLPKDVIASHGLKPGAKVRLDNGGNFIRLHRPTTQLTKVYIEPTVECNLDCITCFWEEPIGRMSEETFSEYHQASQSTQPHPQRVFWRDWRAPLFHPKTIDWIAEIKALGVEVEMITNGTILTEKISQQMIRELRPGYDLGFN